MRWFRKRVGSALAIAGVISSALLLLPSNAASGLASADAGNGPVTILSSGCSGSTCIEASPTDGGYVYVRAHFTHSMCSWRGTHFHFWGPGHNFNSIEGRDCGGRWTDWYGPYNRGTFCVEGWALVGDSWVSLGLPCQTV